METRGSSGTTVSEQKKRVEVVDEAAKRLSDSILQRLWEEVRGRCKKERLRKSVNGKPFNDSSAVDAYS